ncbi:MAG: dihydrolipoamide acetyltransferase family protein [Nocardioidaceae bacterium]
MAEVLRMPEIAANTPEALLASWLVEPHTPYAAGDALVTVETEKAAVDVEAEASGVLLRLLVPEGQQVAVGTPIAIWGASDEPADAVDALLASLGVHEGPADAAAGTDAGPVEPTPAAAPVASSAAPSAPADGRTRIFTSPLARRIAGAAGVDLAAIPGSGPGGRIRRRDVDAFIAARAASPTGSDAPALHVAAAPPAAPVTSVGTSAGWTDEPASRMRQAIARRLTESKQTTPHFYLRGSARVDRLLALRQEVNEGGGTKVSVNDLVVKAVARAHVLVPALNVQWTGDAVRHFAAVDVSVAVATPDGLVTPVLRDVDSLTLTRVAEQTRDLAARAREKRIQPAEIEGGTISVTNLGMHGTEEFAAIINPPQAAILAVGAARQEAVVVDGELAVATVLRVTLAVDHRCVDGAAAAAWMRTFVELLEAPARILA